MGESHSGRQYQSAVGGTAGRWDIAPVWLRAAARIPAVTARRERPAVSVCRVLGTNLKCSKSNWLPPADHGPARRLPGPANGRRRRSGSKLAVGDEIVAAG